MFIKVEKNSYFDDTSGLFVNKVGKRWDVVKGSTKTVLGTYNNRKSAVNALPSLHNNSKPYMMNIM